MEVSQRCVDRYNRLFAELDRRTMLPIIRISMAVSRPYRNPDCINRLEGTLRRITNIFPLSTNAEHPQIGGKILRRLNVRQLYQIRRYLHGPPSVHSQGARSPSRSNAARNRTTPYTRRGCLAEAICLGRGGEVLNGVNNCRRRNRLSRSSPLSTKPRRGFTILHG